MSATISLRVTPAVGNAITITKTISDADLARLQAALIPTFGANTTEVLTSALQFLTRKAVQRTQAYEQTNATPPPSPLPVT